MMMKKYILLVRRLRCPIKCLTFLMLLSASMNSTNSPLYAQTKPEVTRATLKNGLRVVIVRNSLAPVITTQVNYMVGANETPAGFPGTAHAREHTMSSGPPGAVGAEDGR